jgi:expansin (peptidoglycan-binding protein)
VEFHRVATAAGYRDNGGAFVLDPDGNNVEAVNHNR